MFGKVTYITWLALFLGIPLLALILFARRSFWGQRRALGFTLAIALAGGWAWDWLAVHLGAWSFEPGCILGQRVGGLPLEEWLWIAGTTLLFGGLTAVLEDRSRADNSGPGATLQPPN